MNSLFKENVEHSYSWIISSYYYRVLEFPRYAGENLNRAGMNIKYKVIHIFEKMIGNRKHYRM